MAWKQREGSVELHSATFLREAKSRAFRWSERDVFGLDRDGEGTPTDVSGVKTGLAVFQSLTGMGGVGYVLAVMETDEFSAFS